MAKEEIVKSISKSSKLVDQNRKNEAARLEQKVKSHNASVKKNGNDMLSSNNSSVSNSQGNSNLKNKLQKKVGSTALQAIGVPKSVSNTVMDAAQSEQGQKVIKKMNKNMFGPIGGSIMNKLMDLGKEKSTEETSVESTSGDVSIKFIKNALLIFIPVFTPIIILCLFFSASQIYIKSIGLGNADNLSSQDVETKINKKEGSEDLSEEVNEEDLTYDIFIEDESTLFRDKKLEKSNLVFISTTYLKRKYNEADLDEIEDFYPSVTNLSKNYDENMVYDFFFKMYNLYTSYRDKYKKEDGTQLNLDLPLLMSTLMIQSDDMNEIFKSNLLDVDRKKTARKSYDEFDYDYNLSSYKPTKTVSEYDMSILAQNMVSKQVKETCKNENGSEVSSNILKDKEIGTQVLICEDGQTYSTSEEFYDVDNKKYKEFLKTFISQKYSLNENSTTGMIVQIYDAKEQYEDLAGDYGNSSLTVYQATATSYWWPIGSTETVEYDGKTFATGDPESTVITSYFGNRGAIYDSNGNLIVGGGGHGALDIANTRGVGVTNVIAAKSGVVVYPSEGNKTDCPKSSGKSTCGGGYGNYVIIQHPDGNYTLYAHLHANTITVKAGESVEQGQVIAKMGSSGNSTGSHLHFEVRQGQNTSAARVDPLNYVSQETPRQIFTGEEFLTWLNSWEGHTQIDGEYYIVEDIGDGVRTVGGGVTLENNSQLFSKYGFDIKNYPVGSKIPISVIDQMEMEIVNGKRNYIEGILSNNSITLEENEIQALISQMYNTGNISGFVDAYKEYGNTQDFYENWMFRAIMKGTKFEPGLTKRRNAEWALFHAGEYVYNG